jgi:hypothetical protein
MVVPQVTRIDGWPASCRGKEQRASFALMGPQLEKRPKARPWRGKGASVEGTIHTDMRPRTFLMLPPSMERQRGQAAQMLAGTSLQP